MQHKQKLRHSQPFLLENEYLYLAKLIELISIGILSVNVDGNAV